MTTCTWKEVNTALSAEGISARRILLIVKAMPKPASGIRTGTTPYTREQIVNGIMQGYPFSAAHKVRLVNRVIGRLF